MKRFRCSVLRDAHSNRAASDRVIQRSRLGGFGGIRTGGKIWSALTFVCQYLIAEESFSRSERATLGFLVLA